MLFVQIEHNKCDTISDEIHVSFFIEQCISTVFLICWQFFSFIMHLKITFKNILHHCFTAFDKIIDKLWMIKNTQSINIYKFALQTIR